MIFFEKSTWFSVFYGKKYKKFNNYKNFHPDNGFLKSNILK